VKSVKTVVQFLWLRLASKTAARLDFGGFAWPGRRKLAVSGNWRGNWSLRPPRPADNPREANELGLSARRRRVAATSHH